MKAALVELLKFFAVVVICGGVILWLLISCSDGQSDSSFNVAAGDNREILRLGNECVARGGTPVISHAAPDTFVYCFGGK